MKRTRRNHAAGFKAKVALSAIRGEIDRRALNQKLLIAAAMVAVFFLMK